MEELKTCPACGAGQFKFLHKSKDHMLSSESFKIVECLSCHLLFTNPRPDKTEISKYYESADYISHSNTSKGLINKIYQTVRRITLKSKLKLISKINSHKNPLLLDIGCGTGDFLAACQSKGWKTVGIEPNAEARTFAIEKHGLDIFPEEVLGNLQYKPDVITMWHVLEHVHDLRKRLEQISGILNSNGHLIIAVPNPSSWDAKRYKQNWAAYDVPRHLYHFRPEVLKRLVNNFGFTHMFSKPMPFDSFYVSMLTEKYKGGFSGILKAFFVGLISNLSAGTNPEKYSSVIYVFKKN